VQPPWTVSPDFSARRQRRRRLRNIFLGLALAVVVVGLVFLVLGFAPGLLGVRPGALGWRSAGGFLGLFLVFWGALLLLRIAFWSHRWAAGGGPGPHRFDPAIVTARQRYARGEITREQFQQIVSDLRRPPGPPLL
jgi:putative membrane protein